MKKIQYYYKKCKIKNRYVLKIIVSIMILIVLYEMLSINTNKVNSGDNEKNTIEEQIEKQTKNIVGIGKSNNILDENIEENGSGIVVSKSGLILTNEHVIAEGYINYYIIISNKKKIKANIIWSNKELDLAILKVNYVFENCANLGESDEVKIAQRVYSIGNPINVDFSNTVTSGIISGLNRNLEFDENGEKLYINNLIQTDAIINPGIVGEH